MSKPMTPDQVALLDRAKMLSFYKARFSNAADFTFFMVGAFKVDQVLPVLARYVGSLPSTGSEELAVQRRRRAVPDGRAEGARRKGREPRSQTAISFAADPSFDPMEQERVIAATAVLETVLRDSLREDLGQTHRVGRSGSIPAAAR
jgi:zinc protease